MESHHLLERENIIQGKRHEIVSPLQSPIKMSIPFTNLEIGFDSELFAFMRFKLFVNFNSGLFAS